MKKRLFFLPLFCVNFFVYSQKLYGVVNITSPFSGISYTNGYDKNEFRPSIIKANISWGIDLIYKSKKINHKVSVEQVPFEKYFRIINRFIQPPNNDHLLGFNTGSFGTAIDHLIFSYALQKEGIREKIFVFHSRIRFNYSAGLAISFNKSKWYYENVYPNSSYGFASQWTYAGYEAVHHRDGFGLFLRGTGGFDFINKRGKRKICFNIFYDQGLKEMAHYDIHYQYGYFNDPSKQVDVPKQVLRSRGTIFGFSLGIPVVIKK